MANKFSFSDRPIAAKVIYAIVVIVLSITAIIIGVVSAASKPEKTPDDNTVIETPGENDNHEPEETPKDEVKDEKLSFSSPHAGDVGEYHDLTTPVYSDTLGAWRVHPGIDLNAEDGDKVYAAEKGKIKAIYNDPKYGHTVEIEHKDGYITRYSNLKVDSCPYKIGDEVEKGEHIANVGDTATSELAKEPHLHFEMLKDGKKINPLEYLEDRKGNKA